MARDLTGGSGPTTDGASPFSAAPKGLQQQGSARDLTGGVQSPWLKPGWQTGGQTGSTANSFNDDFFNRMYDQYEEEQNKVAADNSYVSNLFLREDYTGIVGWNQTFTKNNPVFGDQLEKDRSFRVGDIYDNGKYLGNVYDSQSGMTLEEANAMVAPHVFGDKAADKYKAADGDQSKLRKLIEEQGEAEGQNVEAYITRVPYQNSVDDLLKQWDDSWLDEAAITAAGVLGGAVTGIVGGPIGIIAGAIAGGVGSFMNQDEARSQAARASVSTGLVAEQEGIDAAIAHATSQWSGLAGTRLNVTTNLLSGIVDGAKIGDNESEIRNAAADGNVGALIGTGVTGFVDGMLQMASPVGRVAYTTSMAGTIVGDAYIKATRDGQWDEVSGTFHRYENMGERLSGAGATLIDAVQSFTPMLLSRSNKLGIGGTRSNTLDDMAETGSLGTRTVMDRTFQIENRGGAGLVATSESKAQGVLAWLAPSTITNRLTVRALAQKKALSENRLSVTADDLYQVATKIEQSTVPWKMALINGFGEAQEEVLQTFLNANAVGWQAEPMEYVQAAIAGFSMGAGMTFGTRADTRSGDIRMMTRANETAILMNERPYTAAEWKAMSREEKIQRSTTTKGIQQIINNQLKHTMRDVERQIVTSDQAIGAHEDAVRQKLKGVISLEGDAFEKMGEILPFESVDIPSHEVRATAQTIVQILNDRAGALTELGTAQPVQQKLQELLDTYVNPFYEDYRSTGNTDALDALNDVLKAYWDGDLLQRQAVELVFTRMPNDNPGSFQMLLPQVDPGMTVDGVHGNFKLGQAYEKLLSHDNDGDKLKHLARYVPNEDTRRIMRVGIHHWATGQMVGDKVRGTPFGGSGFLNVADRAYENAILETANDIMANRVTTEMQHVEKAWDKIESDLKTALKKAVPAKIISDFRKNLDKNPTGAKAEFYRALGQYQSQLFELGEFGNSLTGELQIKPESSIGIWIEDYIQKQLESWRRGLAFRQVPAPTKREDPGVASDPSMLEADVQSKPGLRARTMGQTLAQRQGATAPLRTRGFLAYGAINASNLDADGYIDSDPIRQQLIEWYTTLTRLRKGTQLQTIRTMGNPVAAEARLDLENLARAYAPEEFAADPLGTLFEFANMPFWQLSEQSILTGELDMSKHNQWRDGTIAQALLKASADRNAAEVPTAPGELDQAVLFKNIKPARAMQLLLGDLPMASVLNETEAAKMGVHHTLDSAIKSYTQLGSKKKRQEWRDERKGAYSDTFRKLVDTVRQAVDTELAHGDVTTGITTGRLAEDDRKFHKETVVATFEAVQQIVRRVVGKEVVTSADLISNLENRTRVVEMVLKMLPVDMRIKVIGRGNVPTDPSAVALPGWFFDMLMEPNAEKATMMYWSAMLESELDTVRSKQEDAPATHRNTWVDLYLSLDETARRVFDDARETSNDVLSFVNLVNRQFAYNRPPMLAWRTDTAMFNPAVTRSGWQWAAPSAETRTAIRDAHKYVTQRLGSLELDKTLEKNNLMTAQRMLDSIVKPNKKTTNSAREGVLKLEQMLQQAQSFNKEAVGPQSIRTFLQFAYRGIDPESAAKGKPSPSTAAIGDTDSRRGATGYSDPVKSAMDAVLAVDLDSLEYTPERLNQRLRITTRTGLEIEWNPLSAQSWLELFVADDGAYQGMLWDLVLPIVYDGTPNGSAVASHLLPKDLQGAVEGTAFADLLTNEGPESNELLISYVNSMTPDNGLLKAISRLAIARTTGERARAELSSDDYSRLINDVAKSLRAMAGLVESEDLEPDNQRRTRLKEVLETIETDALLTYVQASDLPELEQTAIRAVGADRLSALAIVAQTREAEVKSARAVYEADQSPENMVNLVNAMQAHSRALALVNATSIGQISFATFKIQWGTESERLTRVAIDKYINTFSPTLETMSTEEDAEALTRFMIAPENDNGLKEFGDDNQAIWDRLADIVSIHNTLRRRGELAAGFIAMPDSGEIDLMDPTFSYVATPFLSTDVLNAVVRLRAATPSTPVTKIDASSFVKTFKQTIMNPREWGPWTPELVSQILNADTYLGSSGSGQQVAKGGLKPQNQLAADLSASRTYTLPPAELAHQYTIPLQDLVESRKDIYDKGLDGDMWALLQGGSVVLEQGQGPSLEITQTDGTVQSIPLNYALETIQGSKGDSTYDVKGLNYNKLVDQAVREFNKRKQQGWTATVNLRMFRPQDKPADPKWANNVHFDGTAGPADTARSAYAAANMGTAGFTQDLQRAALDSSKGGTTALFSVDQERRFDTRDPNKLSELIQEMTADIMNTQVSQKSYIPDTHFRLYLRIVRDRLIVTGEDAEGNLIHRSTEEALTNGVADLINARVTVLSEKSLETLRGSTSGSGHPRILERAPKVGGEGETWLGAYTPEQLERLPQLGRRAEGLTEVAAALRGSNVLSNERITTYAYKNYAYNSQRIGFRPFSSFDRRREDIRIARDEARISTRTQESNIKVGEKLADELTTTHRADEVVVGQLISNLGGVTPDAATNISTASATRSTLIEELNASGSRLWRLNRMNPDNRDANVISSVRDSGSNLYNEIRPVDDIVWVELQSFDGFPGDQAWENAVRDEIQALSELGVKVIFTHSTNPGAIKSAESWLAQTNSLYAAPRTGLPLMIPLEENQMQQTVRAREASYGQGREIPLKNVVLDMLDDSGQIVSDAEGGLFDPRADFLVTGTAVHGSVIPTNLFAHYSSPGTPEAGDRMTAVLNKLRTRDGYQYLAEQQLRGEGREITLENVDALIPEIRELLFRASQNLDPATAWPKTGADFQPGDLYPVFRNNNVSSGAIAWVRWRHEVEDIDFAAQDSVTFQGAVRDGIFSTGSMRFVSSKEVSQDIASARGGEVDTVAWHPTFGLSLVFTTPLTMYGAKIIDDQGKKTRTVEMPENVRPTTPLYRDVWAYRYINGKGERKKGATRGVGLNASTAIAIHGWDGGRALANALGYFDGHPNPGAQFWSRQEWADASESVRAGVLAQVRGLLETQRMNSKVRYSSPADAARAIIEQDPISETARMLAAQASGNSLAGAQLRAGAQPADLTARDAELQYLSAVLTYLSYDGARVGEVFGAPGLQQPAGQIDRKTYEMPAAISEFIDSNLDVRAYIQEDMNSRMVRNRTDSDGTLLEGWQIRTDWRLEQRNADGSTRLFTPRLSTIMATGEDQAESSVMAAESATRDTASNQSQSLAAATIGLDLGYAVRDQKLDKLMREEAYIDGSRRRLPYNARMNSLQGKSLEAQQREARADYIIRGGWEPLQPIEAYSTVQERTEVTNGYKLIYDALGLTADGSYKRIVDMMVRTFYRAWHDPENPGVAELNAQETTYALQKILSSLNDGKWPFVGGRAPAIHADVVATIANEGTWSPDNKPVREGRLQELLLSAMESMMASTERITPDAQLEMDGLLNTYQKFLDEGVWPVSHFPEVIKDLLDKDGDKFVSSMDPNTQLRLERGDPYRDYDTAAIGETGIYNPTTDAGTKTEIARRNRQDIVRGRTSGGLERQTVAQIRKRGRVLRSEVRTTNDFWANAHALRTIMPQLNPLLWVWNPVDKAFRRMPATAASILSGASTGFLGRRMRDTVNSISDGLDKSLNALDPESKRAKLLETIQGSLGLEGAYITPLAQSKIKDTIDRLVTDPEWRATIFGETRHRPDYGLMSRTDQTRQRLVDNVSKLQDIGYGLKPTAEAQMYITQVLEHERVVNPDVASVDVLLNLLTDPLYYQKRGPQGAHEQAVRNIQNTMGAKLTTMGVLADKILLPAASSSNWIVGNAANTLLLLMKYRNFAMSTLVNATGSQGLDAAASILAQTLSFRKAYVADQKGIQDVKVTDYVGQVLESADIADMFIRSGLSHTGLFMAALALGASGLTGEDEEERRRRRIEKLQGLGRLYDPRDIVNDFRNRDAVWLEGLATNPLGAAIAAHFAVPTGEGGDLRAPTQLHWTLNFFTAPALGIAAFLQTGDFYDIAHGFESAIGQMPLVNTNMWWDAVATAETMYTAATNDVQTTGGSTDGMAYLIKVVGVFEKALLENAFINELYAASTEHNVNAWGKVETEQDGSIVRDRDQVPELTDATEPMIDDNPQSPTFGQVIERRQTEDYYRGLVKNFTSTNATAAFLSTLLTGLQFNKGGSFMRADMAAAQTTLERTGISEEDGAALIMSVYNNEENKEVLTELGAERIIDSLHAGTVRANDPALQNIFLTGDQRAAISDTIQSKLYLEGIQVLGLDEDKATERMWDIWNGTPYAVALSDVVWSQNEFAGDNGIPWLQTATYRELNTTFAQGPDGKLWATGVPRSTLIAPGIISPLGTYYGAAGADGPSNLGVDEILNSTDAMANLNTGFRALTRKDESLSIPDEEDILEMIKASTDRVIDAIKDARSDLYNQDKYGGGYRYSRGGGGRGGGGGGGGGYANNPLMPFLNGMRQVYADNVPQIYINNINPRRATIRRERFSSERGRLNQWQ